MPSETVTVQTTPEGTVAALAGRLVTDALTAFDRAFGALPGGPLTLDLARLEALDTGGAWLLLRLKAAREAAGSPVVIRGATEAQVQLLDTVAASLPREAPPPPAPGGPAAALERLGRGTTGSFRVAIELLDFLGVTMARSVGVLLRPWRLRLTSLVYQMGEAGLNAVPIVALLCFLIGVVLGYQGAAQLRQFGAEVFVVDLIAISILRELGVLLTAIIVAGRSASAFTSAIGSMKMREEIDAMRTLGLDPIEVLVVPRLLAMLLMLPALTVVANLVGLVGGGVMAWVELGISPPAFTALLLEATDINHFYVGMVKAPVFALIIAVVGCFQGMKVELDAASLGRRTSISVVLAIFLVIITDATFSIFFAVLGI